MQPLAVITLGVCIYAGCYRPLNDAGNLLRGGFTKPPGQIVERWSGRILGYQTSKVKRPPASLTHPRPKIMRKDKLRQFSLSSRLKNGLKSS
jgi:hypothetical protein